MSSIETDAELLLGLDHSGRRTAQFVRNFLPADLRSTAKILAEDGAIAVLSSSIKRQK
jgi:hypothetical protein